MPVFTDDHINTFFRDGYVAVEQVFDESEMSAIDAGFERIHAIADAVAQSDAMPRDASPYVKHGGSGIAFGPNPGGWETYGHHVKFIAWCGGLNDVLDQFGQDQRLLEIAAKLLGSNEMDHLIHQAHFKRPGTGVKFPMHQDATHRGMHAGHFDDINGKGSFVQTAIVIDDMTPENGPLSFIPGSQSLGHLPFGDAYAKVDPTTYDASTAVTPLLKRGDVAVFGPYCIHGSEPNLSAAARRIFINGYAYPGANKREYVGRDAGRRLVYRG